MAAKAEQALGLGTKIVDVLAGGVDHKVRDPRLRASDIVQATDTHQEPRINVAATGHHVDTVHESHENERRRREAEKERRAESKSGSKADSDFEPIHHSHGPGVARPGDADRLQQLEERVQQLEEERDR